MGDNDSLIDALKAQILGDNDILSEKLAALGASIGRSHSAAQPAAKSMQAISKSFNSSDQQLVDVIRDEKQRILESIRVVGAPAPATSFCILTDDLHLQPGSRGYDADGHPIFSFFGLRQSEMVGRIGMEADLRWGHLPVAWISLDEAASHKGHPLILDMKEFRFNYNLEDSPHAAKQPLFLVQSEYPGISAWPDLSSHDPVGILEQLTGFRPEECELALSMCDQDLNQALAAMQAIPG